MKKFILPAAFMAQKIMCGIMNKPLKPTGYSDIGMMHKAGCVEALG